MDLSKISKEDMENEILRRDNSFKDKNGKIMKAKIEEGEICLSRIGWGSTYFYVEDLDRIIELLRNAKEEG